MYLEQDRMSDMLKEGGNKGEKKEACIESISGHTPIHKLGSGVDVIAYD